MACPNTYDAVEDVDVAGCSVAEDYRAWQL
jgi:hypothetical protein